MSIVADDAGKAERNLWHLAVRWLAPQAYLYKFGNTVQTSNVMGGETGVFLLPHTFGAAVGRTLVETMDRLDAYVRANLDAFPEIS